MQKANRFIADEKPLKNPHISHSEPTLFDMLATKRRSAEMERRYDFFFRRFILRKRRSGFSGLCLWKKEMAKCVFR